MEHFIRVCFGIVTLSLLQAKSIPTTIPRSNFRIEEMQKIINCSEDLKLYTPQNVKKECLTAALDCVRKELNGTVKIECEGSMRSTDQTVRALDHKIKERNAIEHGHASPQSSECACEKWPETNFTEFLNHSLILIDQAHSEASGR